PRSTTTQCTAAWVPSRARSTRCGASTATHWCAPPPVGGLRTGSTPSSSRRGRRGWCRGRVISVHGNDCERQRNFQSPEFLYFGRRGLSSQEVEGGVPFPACILPFTVLQPLGVGSVTN